MSYTIKTNLPNFLLLAKENCPTKDVARNAFLAICKDLSSKYPCKMFLRDTYNKPLRGQIQVEIDGFFYYVELFINND